MTARTLLLFAAWSAAMPVFAADRIDMAAEQRQALGIRVAALEPTRSVAGARVPARVVIPPTQVRVVAASQGGLVEEVLVEVGTEVREGQPLARIQSPELVRLQRDFLQALSQERLARSELKRDQKLLKEGVIAERRYLATHSRHEELSATLEQSRQTLRLAGMNDRELNLLPETRRLSSAFSLYAPIAGVVLERMAEPGERVETADPLYRIARLDPLWLEAQVPLEEAGVLAEGDIIRIPGHGAEGRVIMVGANVDPTSQTVLVRAEITSGKQQLRPGQYVEAVFTKDRLAARYAVPAGAVVRDGDRELVFVDVGDGFEPRDVQLFGIQDGRAVVGDHFKGHEQVAVTGTAAIKGAWMGLGGGE